MKTPIIDSSRIQAMMEQLKAAAARPEKGIGPIGAPQPADKPGFADALKASLDKVNDAQMQSEKLGQRFSMGDNSVSLSDVMITAQKSSIAFQATVQVRNKLASAYQDIMNMQI